MPFSTLPTETLLSICSYLPRGSLPSLSRVSRRLSAVCSHSLDKFLSADADRVLFWASSHGNEHTMRRAILSGASPTAVRFDLTDLPSMHSSSARSPLLTAVGSGRISAVRLLLEYGAPVDMPTLGFFEPFGPVGIAAALGYVDILALLLDAKSGTERVLIRRLYEALLMACRKGQVPCAKIVLRRWVGLDGFGHLVHGEQSDDVEVIIGKRLKDLRAAVQHYYGDNPAKLNKFAIQAACITGQAEVVRALLEHMAKIDAAAEKPVILVVEGAHQNVLEVLIENAADVNVVDKKGRSLIQLASEES